MSTGLAALVRQPLWRRWTAASFLGRLPMTMTVLALVLIGERVTGSVAVGAQLSGVAIFTAGIAAPLRGRQLDRGGVREGVRDAGLLTAAVLGAQIAAVLLGLPLVVFYVLAAAQGAAMAAISGGFRALLVGVVSAEDLPRANTLEAVFVEIAFVAGPSLAGVLALMVGPVGVLAAMVLAAAGSATLVMTLPAGAAHVSVGDLAPWRAAGAWPVYVLALAMGATVGVLESALPGRAKELGMVAASAGPLLALTAAGSAVGGLLAAVRRDQRRRQGLFAVVLLLLFAALLSALAESATVLVLGVLLFAVGVPIAPLNALGSMRLQDSLPVSRLGEGFALYTAMILVGAGLGQSATGQLLDELGAQALLLVSAAVPLLAAVGTAAVVLRTRRRQAATQPLAATRP